MKRFWIDEANKKGDEFLLEGELFKHTIQVCRLERGQKFELLTDASLSYLVELKDISSNKARAVILEQKQMPHIKKPWIHLCLSFPKFNTFEWILEKSVELGVLDIHPFFSDFSFIKTLEKISREKWKRWEKIIQSSCQQSARGTKLVLHAPLSLQDFLSHFKIERDHSKNLFLFLYEGVCDTSLKEHLLENKKDELEHIWLFVGSEGGFSKQEVKTFEEQGIRSLTLGDQILRVETACIALSSILKYEFNGFHREI